MIPLLNFSLDAKIISFRVLFKNIPNFKQYRTQMVTTDFSKDLFNLFSELKNIFKKEPILN